MPSCCETPVAACNSPNATDAPTTVPPLLAVTPSWTGVFLVYGGALKVIGSNDLASVTAAGAVSGTIYSVVMCPFEIVKVNAQKAQVSALVAARQLCASVGIRGMYRGFGACLVRDISQSAVYYYCAESLNRSERVSRVCGDGTALIAGAITGVAHVSMEFPFDTVKSRFQTNPRLATYSECVRELASKSELRRVSAALIPALSRAVFAHSAAFLAVQAAKDFIIPPSSGNPMKST